MLVVATASSLSILAQVLQAEYKRRVDVEQAQHDVTYEPIRQRNTERHEAAARRVEQRKHIEKANEDLILAAQQLHQQRLYEVKSRSAALCLAAVSAACVCPAAGRHVSVTHSGHESFKYDSHVICLWLQLLAETLLQQPYGARGMPACTLTIAAFG